MNRQLIASPRACQASLSPVRRHQASSASSRTIAHHRAHWGRLWAPSHAACGEPTPRGRAHMISSRLLNVTEGDNGRIKAPEGSESPSTSLLRGHGVAPPAGLGKRHLLACFLFMGTFIVYVLRVILSVAIQPMSKEFGWDNPTRGLVLSSFFIGYAVLQIPGGWWASNRGKMVFGLGVLAPALITAATPFVAHSLPLMVTARILTGLGEGVTYPAIHALMGRWAPHAERARMVSFVWAGAYTGTMCAFPAAGLVIRTPSLGVMSGWRGVFYLSGILGAAWWLGWMYVVSSTPEQHPTISDEEREYIKANLPPRTEGSSTPWAKLLSYAAVWAIVVQHFCHNWGFYTLLTWLPTYLNDELDYNLKDAGFASILPYFACMACSISGGWLADGLIKRRWKIRRVRCIMQVLAEFVPAVCLVVCSYVSSPIVAVAYITGAVGASGLAGGGFGSNHLDLVPEYAGPLFGLSNTVATIPGVVSPYLTGLLLGDYTAPAVPPVGHWRVVFYLSGGIAIFGLAFFAYFSRGRYIVLRDEEPAKTKPNKQAGNVYGSV